MNQHQIDKIIADHKLWLNDNSTGKRADFSGVDLSWADLRNCIGNNKEIKTLQLGIWVTVHTDKMLYIGCEAYTWERWMEFTDDEIGDMDNAELAWAPVFRPVLVAIYKNILNNR